MEDVIILSVLAGLATGIGALIAFSIRVTSPRFLSLMLGFAGGIMLSISAFNLLHEAVNVCGLSLTIVGFVLGAALMFGLDLALPHMHRVSFGREGGHESERYRRERKACPRDVNPDMLRLGYYVFLGIALHNLPEGLAIGAGYESSYKLGLAIALSIGLHNIPEGIATAVPLTLGGVGKFRVFLMTCFAGLMTAVGTIIGIGIIRQGSFLIGVSLAFAAGAMVYIVSDELIPQSHKYHSHWANLGLVLGFIVGLVID